MPTYPGVSYKAKARDHMDKVIIRACPTCGAAIGNLCVTRRGNPVLKIENVHSARFNSRDEKRAKTMATHWAAL